MPMNQNAIRVTHQTTTRAFCVFPHCTHTHTPSRSSARKKARSRTSEEANARFSLVSWYGEIVTWAMSMKIMRPIIFESALERYENGAQYREQSQRQRQRIMAVAAAQQQRHRSYGGEWVDANYHFDKWFSLSDSVKLESFINFISKKKLCWNFP